MIERLEIKDFLFIQEAKVRFSPGFNVITGETGAGKSLFLSALKAVFGEKLKGSSIRAEASEATIRAFFKSNTQSQQRALMKILLKWEIFSQDTSTQSICITRVLRKNGSDLCFINDREVPHELLNHLSSLLIDIHSQRQNQYLLKSENHLYFYDSFLGLREDRKNYRKAFRSLREHHIKLQQFKQDQIDGAGSKDFLEFLVKELSAALEDSPEYDTLKKKLLFLETEQKLADEAALFHQARLNVEKSFQAITASLKRLSSVRAISGDLKRNLSNQLGKLQETEALLKRDIAHTSNLLVQKDRGAEIDSIQEKLAAIETLERKYKTNVDGLTRKLQDAEKKLTRLQQGDKELAQLEKAYKESYAEAYSLAAKLHKNRLDGVPAFNKQLQKELDDLGMSGGSIEVRIKPTQESHPSQKRQNLDDKGFTKLELFYSASPEMPPKAFRQIASGGELSRMMLALKSILAKQLLVGVIVFDEIDTGVGGRTALRLANRLLRLSKTKQILVITHLPQIARSAESHFSIQKQLLAKEQKTRSLVLQLETEKEKLEEICRMLGRSISPENIAFAKKFLED